MCQRRLRGSRLCVALGLPQDPCPSRSRRWTFGRGACRHVACTGGRRPRRPGTFQSASLPGQEAILGRLRSEAFDRSALRYRAVPRTSKRAGTSSGKNGCILGNPGLAGPGPPGLKKSGPMRLLEQTGRLAGNHPCGDVLPDPGAVAVVVARLGPRVVRRAQARLAVALAPALGRGRSPRTPARRGRRSRWSRWSAACPD